MTDASALQALRDAAETIRSALSHSAMSADVVRDELIIRARREDIVRVLLILRDDPRLSYSQLADLAGVDYPDQAERFEIVYNLLSLSRNQRCRVKVTAGESDSVPSVAGI